MGEDDELYLLMCKDYPVLRFSYDHDAHVPARIVEVIDPTRAPVALFAPDRGHPIGRKQLLMWWRDRAIPFTRDNFKAMRLGLGVDDTAALLEECNALSLSDCYWVKGESDSRTWGQVNFFDNDFDDELGLVTLGQTSSATTRRNPSSSLVGDLRKMWTIEDGERVLLKAGRGALNQEPYNELVATRMYELLLGPEDLVPYDLETRGQRIYSRCPNMLGHDEELVPAWGLRRVAPRLNTENWYQFYVRILGSLGIRDAARAVDQMIVCDYLIGNHDRHWNNFGVIRNVESREFVRVAPLFDTGNSLWCNVPVLDAPIDFNYEALPFMGDYVQPERQLRLVGDLAWLDRMKARELPTVVADVLAANQMISESRRGAIAREVARRAAVVAG